MKFTQNDYHKYLAQFIPDKYRELISENELEKCIENEYNFINKRLENLKRAEKLKEICGVEGAEIADYRVRILEFETFYVIVSIRFMGLDVTKPFLEIEFYNTDVITFASHLHKIKSKVIEEFCVFQCTEVSILISNQFLDLFKTFQLKLDKAVFSIPLLDVYKKTPPKIDLKLEKVDDFSEKDYQIYLLEYKQFCESNPHLEGVHAEPLNTIREKAKSDYVFKIFQNNEWAGLCIYAKMSEYFLYGYLVWDKIIFEKFRGQNLSSYAQEMAFQNYIPKLDGFIFGYINIENFASIHSAQKTGRENLFGFYRV